MDFSILTLQDRAYPALLREIQDPPPKLWVWGRLPSHFPAVAIVGARKASAYGRATAEQFATALAAAGLWIVSGLALGTDSAAHRGALSAGGRTVAVLGSGLDRIYPPENQSLAGEIVDRGGVVLSEFERDTEPAPYRFPQRNRIISGLSRAVLVVEAGEKSGALITARLAAEQGREVFVIPHDISRESGRGCLRLIKEGATAVGEPEEILDTLGIEAETSRTRGGSETEKELLSLLAEPRHIDEIARAIAKPISEVSTLLTHYELRGLVRNFGNGIFGAIRRTKG